MDVFKQYDTFKEKCLEFQEKLEEKYFADNKLICHPTAENVLISLCSDEEAHSNALCICRMADMLLMSSDNAEWSTFNLMEARSIAEQEGFIYLTDLLGESAFYSEEWMINGKNDTIIVNEEYMRSKGKRYAPVTPLTNKVLHFKKYNNELLWKPSSAGEIFCISKEYIDGRFKELFESYKEKLPDLSKYETIKFKMFGGEITIDVNTTRIRTIEHFFDRINKIIESFSGNEEIFDICEYDFSEKDFLLELTVEALKKNGMDISKEKFTDKYYTPVLGGSDTNERLERLPSRCGNDELDCIKLAFIDAVNAEYEEKIDYSVGDGKFYNDSIRSLELGKYSEEEEKYAICDILSNMPADYRIFYYTERKYPDEAANLAEIAAFWRISSLPDDEMENTILGAYILDENFDEQGRFCAGYEESRILKEQLEIIIAKYGISSREVIDELEQHIDILDKERRTFNGTLFNSPEEMKLAVKNEAYIQDMCVDLSALNEQELNALDEHIDNTTLDDNTKSKYKLKVKLALSNVQSSMLEQRCLKLPIMTLDEIAELRNKIEDEDYPEAVVKPFQAKIKDAYCSAQTAEIEEMLKDSEKLSDKQLEEISEKLGSDRYDSTISDHYKQKIDEIRETNIRTELEILTEGYESLDKEKLAGLIDTLNESKYPKKLTLPWVDKLTDTLNNYEINEAAKAFDGVDFADKEQLEEMKKIISDKKFSDEILAPYIIMVEQREKALLDEKLMDMCKDIDTISTQDELDLLKEEITDESYGFDSELVSKYVDKITQRSCELQNSELAELCKYIFSMEQEELDELKVTLADEKYDKEFTGVYYKKIVEREQELLVAELDKICENIDSSGIEELEELKTKILDDEKYADICDSYIASINDKIDSIKIANFKDLITSVSEMTSSEVEDFRRTAENKRDEIGEELYEQSIAAADEREEQIENDAIEQLCGGIEDYTFEIAERVKTQLVDNGYAPEKIAPYIARIEGRITELHTAELDSIIDGLDTMDKEQLVNARISVEQYDNGCTDELKVKYFKMIESAMADIADREMRDMCGNVEELSAKKSFDLIRRINTMALDDNAKKKYIDLLDAHIVSLKEVEAKNYLKYLKEKMEELNVTSTYLAVPGLSDTFFDKYNDACSKYVSIGRYEQPILVHDNGSNDGFTITTDYFYAANKEASIKINILDIASFQAKKTLVSAILNMVEKNGNNHEIPHALNKNIIDNTAKVLTALISFIHDKRAAEQMKELLENAVQEKAVQTPAPASATSAAPAEPAAAEPEKKEEKTETASKPETESETAEVKVKFCDQCGAKITSPNAKFCAECGNKLQ